ncbi:MAG: DinB family protein [Acidimicrobiales bacterium]
MAAEEFKNRDLAGSHFQHVDLSRVTIHDALMRDVRITGAWMVDLVLDGDVEGSLTVNGVDVVPYMHEVLNARYPGRETVFAVMEGDADAFRAAWAIDQQVWASTVERARRLPEAKLHERVDGEWSFIQTLRHLVFATDSWIRRAIQGDPRPYDVLGLPFSEMGEIDGVPNDVEARPSLDEVLDLRADRMQSVTDVIDALTDEQLEGTTEPVTDPGYPESEAFPVRRCLAAVVIEEWEHHLFANRDLAVLEAQV